MRLGIGSKSQKEGRKPVLHPDTKGEKESPKKHRTTLRTANRSHKGKEASSLEIGESPEGEKKKQRRN